MLCNFGGEELRQFIVLLELLLPSILIKLSDWSSELLSDEFRTLIWSESAITIVLIILLKYLYLN